MLQNETDIGDTKRMVARLEEDVRRFELRGFTSKKSSKRPARDDDENLPGPSKRPARLRGGCGSGSSDAGGSVAGGSGAGSSVASGSDAGGSGRGGSCGTGHQASRHAGERIPVPNTLVAHGSTREVVSKV